MSKQFIGKKKKNGFVGLAIFCLLAFALTFVISYTFKDFTEKNKNENLNKNDISRELDELFADNSYDEGMQKENRVEENNKEIDKKVEPVKMTEKIVPEIVTEEEPVVDMEVSAKPEKAVIPLDEGGIIRKFSAKAEYSEFFEDWRSHTGVDISGKPGDEVRTVADGTVVESYIDPLCGGTMKIDHGAFYSAYMGLDPENMEMNGTVVKKGDTIGLLQGNIMGETAEPHLHFEIIENEVYTDPMKYIG